VCAVYICVCSQGWRGDVFDLNPSSIYVSTQTPAVKSLLLTLSLHMLLRLKVQMFHCTLLCLEFGVLFVPWEAFRHWERGGWTLTLGKFTAFHHAGLGFGKQKAVILSFFQAVMRPVLAQAAAEWRDRNTYVKKLCGHLSWSGQGHSAADTQTISSIAKRI